jgi:excisionase family DNA binding protein
MSSAVASALLAELDDAALAALADRLAPLLAGHQTVSQPDPWLTVDQAAAYLACRRQRVYNLVSQRRLRHAKDGSRVLFRRQWLDDYIEASS